MRCRKLTMMLGVGISLLCLYGCAATRVHKQRAAASRAQTASPQFEQALRLMHAQRYTEAIHLLEALVKAQPTLSVAILNLAIAHARSGHDAQAEPLLRQLIAQSSDNAKAWNELGMLQRRAGHFTDARQAYETAIAVNADYADAQLNLAILYDLYLHQAAQAIPHYQRYQTLAAAPDKRVTLWLAQLNKTTPLAKGNPQP